MEDLILALFIAVIVALNIFFFISFKKGKLPLFISGILMLMLAPVFGFSSGAFFSFL